MALFGKKPALIQQEQKLWKELQELNKIHEALNKKRALLSAELMKGSLGEQDLSALTELENELAKTTKRIAEKTAELTSIQSKPLVGSESKKPEIISLTLALKEKEAELASLLVKQSSFDEAKEKKLKLLNALLEKYSGLINEAEKKTVSQIKGLVDSENQTIQSIAQKIKKESYSDSLNALLEFIYKEIAFVSLESELKLSYWLKPEEIMQLKMADDEDMAVFTCSIMKASGDEKAIVLITELSDLNTKAFVATEFNGLNYLIDVAGKKPLDSFTGKTIEEAMQAFDENGLKIKKTLYKFNNETYEQFI